MYPSTSEVGAAGSARRHAQFRASDADRNAVLQRLAECYGQGRLTSDELDQRLAAACQARTYGELDTLLRDLPTPSGLAHVHQLADALLTESARLGISRGELAGLLASRA